MNPTHHKQRTVMNITMRLQKAGLTVENYHSNAKTLSRMDIVTLKK